MISRLRSNHPTGGHAGLIETEGEQTAMRRRNALGKYAAQLVLSTASQSNPADTAGERRLQASAKYTF